MPRKGYLQIKVSESEHDTLRRLAAESQVTVSDWVRGAIRAKTASQIGGKLSFSPDSELESIRQELRAPDFEYLQLLFAPGNPARSLELWCRTKAQLGTRRREWYLLHARQIANLQQNSKGDKWAAKKMFVFSWGQSAIFAVKKEGGQWYRTAIIAQFKSSVDILMPVCIEALKREGWAWVDPSDLEEPT